MLDYCENNIKHITTPCFARRGNAIGKVYRTVKKGIQMSRRYGDGDIRFLSFLIPAIDGKSGQFCSLAALSLESSSTFLDYESEWTPEPECAFEVSKSVHLYAVQIY
jgi:hypothetical protein